LTPLQAKFAAALDLIEACPDEMVVKWCSATLVIDAGPRVGIPPTEALYRSRPELSPEQQEQACHVINDALALLRGPDEHPA
jgi:hypothetical protein